LKALLHVQYLLGVGHARRAALIAGALAKAGVEVVVADGGFPIAGVELGSARFVQLPPARTADPSFKVILDEEGRPIDDAWKRRRRELVLDLFETERPDALLVETFPFGRRAFKFELAPLLDLAAARRPRPLIASLVRDILVRKIDGAKYDDMAAMARRWLDLALVHSDPAIVPLDATFPRMAEVAHLVRYTGYVAPGPGTPEPPPGVGEGEVLVSVGGGATGHLLLETALEARPLTAAGGATWRLLAGPHTPAPVVESLARAAGEGVIVERARPDFPGLVRRARLSVSQGGYNTVMDVLSAGARSLVVPFSGEGQTEQLARARLLARRGLIHLLPDRGLTPERLARAIDRAIAAPAPPTSGIDMGGAAATARLIAEAIQGAGNPRLRS
jgi:predicted glycosyltransferase